MKKGLILMTILLVLFLLVPQVSCIGIRGVFPSMAPRPVVTGSSNMATWEYDFTDFTDVNVSSAFSVDISQSDSYSVSITANENILDYLSVYQKDETIYVGLELASYRNVQTEAKISMPTIASLELSGASDGEINDFSSSDPLNLELSGASLLLGNIETGDFNIHLSGASRVQLTGSGDNLDVHASGASQVELANYIVNNANVKLSGASSAYLKLNGRLNADLSGASRLLYSGEPSLGDIELSGGSTISEQ